MDSRNITQTVANICKFVTEECCYVGGKFFNIESELGTEEKYVNLRHWKSDTLDMTDYKLPDIFE